MLRLVHRSLKTGREKIIWRTQLHTFFFNDLNLVLKKADLDDAYEVIDIITSITSVSHQEPPIFTVISRRMTFFFCDLRDSNFVLC